MPDPSHLPVSVCPWGRGRDPAADLIPTVRPRSAPRSSTLSCWLFGLNPPRRERARPWHCRRMVAFAIAAVQPQPTHGPVAALTGEACGHANSLVKVSTHLDRRPTRSPADPRPSGGHNPHPNQRARARRMEWSPLPAPQSRGTVVGGAENRTRSVPPALALSYS